MPETSLTSDPSIAVEVPRSPNQRQSKIPGPIPKPRPGPIPKPRPGPIPKPSSGPIPKPSSGPIPKPSSGPIPKPSSGPIPKPSSGPIPKPSSGPIPKPSSGPIPKPSSNSNLNQNPNSNPNTNPRRTGIDDDAVQEAKSELRAYFGMLAVIMSCLMAFYGILVGIMQLRRTDNYSPYYHHRVLIIISVVALYYSLFVSAVICFLHVCHHSIGRKWMIGIILSIFIASFGACILLAVAALA